MSAVEYLKACVCGEPARTLLAVPAGRSAGANVRPQPWPLRRGHVDTLGATARRGRLAGVAAACWVAWVEAA